MKKLVLFGLLSLFSCTGKEKVEIRLDKEFVLPGETITARIYVKHNNSVLPSFRILTGYDTAMLPIDEKDNQCGVYRARFKSTGTRKVSGFVIFTDEQNKTDTLNYQFKFDVEVLPALPGRK